MAILSLTSLGALEGVDNDLNVGTRKPGAAMLSDRQGTNAYSMYESGLLLTLALLLTVTLTTV